MQWPSFMVRDFDQMNNQVEEDTIVTEKEPMPSLNQERENIEEDSNVLECSGKFGF